MDVKHVPSACYVGRMPDKFYQYTVIDEASRERFIYPYKEQSSYSTIDFVKRAIAFFGYKPETIQTDNGSEFTYSKEYKRTHPFDKFCESSCLETRTYTTKNSVAQRQGRTQSQKRSGEVLQLPDFLLI